MSSTLGHFPRIALTVAALAAAAWAGARADDQPGSYDLIAVNADAGRAVLLHVDGETEVLRLDHETPDGLRLKSVTADSALIEVRHKSHGEIIGYRIKLGDTLRIRPLPEHRAGGVRVISNSPESPTGPKESSG